MSRESVETQTGEQQEIQLKKRKNLDECGLEISGCRHGLAQHAINMMYGEIYGYAHYLQVNYYIPKNVEFFWYDVICKYWPWLKKNDPATSKKMSLALSVMHAKAHDWSCQVLVWLCPILLAYEFFCMDTVWFCFNHEIFYVFWWYSMYINKCNFHVGLVGWSLAEWGSCNYWGGGWAHQ